MTLGKFNAPTEIGLIGLGVMGTNLAFNIADKGYKIAVYNRPQDRPLDFPDRAGALAERIRCSDTLYDLVAAVRAPRPIMLMVTAGDAVDAQISALRPLLSPRDIIIDAGNSHFRDTIRRHNALRDKGLSFIGMGVSGGAEGARHGPSIMAGGERESYDRIEGILRAIAARHGDEPCCAHVGPDGAGHFVKMIHNGIEYADMQMIAEIYGLMRDALHLSAAEIGAVFERWNRGRLNSYLIEMTADVLKADDPKSGSPMVNMILDRAGQKGTGCWSAVEAQTLGVAATTLEAAVAARALSALKTEREAAAELYGTETGMRIADKDAFIGHLERALFAGKINAYAQGFAVMAEASRDYGWQLPLGEVARVWRAGCIIRSQFLDSIAAAFRDAPQMANLLAAPAFAIMMREAARPCGRWWRRQPLPACRFRRSVPLSAISRATARRAAPPTSSRPSATFSARTGSSAWTRKGAVTTGRGHSKGYLHMRMAPGRAGAAGSESRRNETCARGHKPVARRFAGDA